MEGAKIAGQDYLEWRRIDMLVGRHVPGLYNIGQEKLLYSCLTLWLMYKPRT